MIKKGFIFDLDGVIVDTAKYHFLAWENLANQLGFQFTKEQNEMFKGVSRKRCLEILLDLGKIDATQDQFDKWMVEKNIDYLKYIDNMDESEILPDVMRILDLLKKHKQPIALGSASKNAQPILEKVGLISYFDSIVDGNHVTKAKPDPEVFLIAANQLGIHAPNCLVFEDAVAGIQAANNAQMTSIGIGSKEYLHEAKYVFNNFTEIKNEFLINFIKN